MAAAYLFAGAVVMFAYTTAHRGDGGYDIRWSAVPQHALWLAPGVLLGLCACFLRRSRWAILLAAAMILATIPLVAPRFAFYFFLFRLAHYHGRTFVVYLPLWGSSLCLLVTGLALLCKQWRSPLEILAGRGGGFEVLAVTESGAQNRGADGISTATNH